MIFNIRLKEVRGLSIIAVSARINDECQFKQKESRRTRQGRQREREFITDKERVYLCPY